MSLEKQTKEVVEVCREVGAFIAQERKSFSEELVKTKGAKVHDLVTHVDLESEKRLVEALKKIEPRAGFITEETNKTYKDGLNWIVDPIDGTTNFVQNVPHYCISVALAKGNDLLMGVVFDVANKQAYHSFKNGASFCDHVEISISSKKSLTDFLVATGFSVKETSRLQENLDLLKIWIEQTRGIRRLGSAALDLCYVASGVFDVFYETNLSAWDVAAGALIVKNAGGTVTDFSGENSFLFGDEILATNGFCHKEITELIHKSLA